jgi:hypothetical protein
MTKLLDKLFNHRTIVNCEREPYLKRWYLIRRPRIAFFLHRFYRSDEDRALHDHPWSFITVILWRGYLEHTERRCPRCVAGGYHAFAGECAQCDDKKTVAVIKRKWPGMICFRRAEHRHRVELVAGKPAWTLVIRFKERRDWGFWERGGFVQWNKWWQNNCE